MEPRIRRKSRTRGSAEPARRKPLALLVSIAMAVGAVAGATSPTAAADERAGWSNLALDATAGADKQNTPAANVNNGYLATTAATSWNTWSSTAITYPTTVWLEWDTPQELTGSRVIWWADSTNLNGADNVTFPQSATIEYLNGSGSWVPLTGMLDEQNNPTDQVGVVYETNDGNGLNGANKYWNEVLFSEPISTTKLRMVIQRNGSGRNGVGISEWEAYGVRDDSGGYGLAQGKNIAPEATVTVGYENTGTSAANVNDMALAGGSATSWNTWKSEGDLSYPQPIEYTWDEPREIKSMRVMWWADQLNLTGGVQYPKSAVAQYLDPETGTWADITGMTNEESAPVDQVGTRFTPGATQGSNRYWNGVVLDAQNPVKTTAVRLLVDRPTGVSDARAGIGIGEWEVYGDLVTDEFVAARISGKASIIGGEVAVYHASALPSTYEGDFDYEWSIEGDAAVLEGATDQESLEVTATGKGTATVRLTLTERSTGEVRRSSFPLTVEEVTGIETYRTSTVAGLAPVLPGTVVANGIQFDDPTPDQYNTGQKTVTYNFAETFESKLVPVVWDEVAASKYGVDKVGSTFEVHGTASIQGVERAAIAEITVNAPAEAPEANVAVTFEKVKITDDFWLPIQKRNMTKSLGAAIYQIGLASGGEPNFVNAAKRLNGEKYDPFRGFVFQDTDVYKTLEAISYTLTNLQNETDPELLAQKQNLEDTLDRWVGLIQDVQYADGYINTHFTLRSSTTSGGRAAGTHRWRNLNNHEMYNAGHFLEAVVAYTRYREGIGDPDYSLYVAGKRFADHIVERFGPGGTRHEVPGHEEIELALTKFSELVEEHEGAGSGTKYVKTAQTLIDRRGENINLRETKYDGYSAGDRKYSQDRLPFTVETEAVGHAVRAAYLYTGATDVARLLGGEVASAYLPALDNVWNSVINRKSYITGSIGVASHGEDFGGDYELPNNDSYAEICASIALANWNLRMNLVHEHGKYADAIERTLYNAILAGVNLGGDQFYYSNRLEVPAKNGGYVNRASWFDVACCPPNLMRTLAKVGEYMYTTHGDNVFVNLYIGSEAELNVSGTKVVVTQATSYPNDGNVEITMDPAEAKEFTVRLRIPSWLAEQTDSTPVISVNGEKITADAEKGYVSITRTWEKGDKIDLDLPMEIRMTEADPSVTTNQGKVAIERGPLVFAMEKAGNVQRNPGITGFDPRNIVLPRTSVLTADYNADLLGGVVEITGQAQYASGATRIPVDIQAIPFFAHNNRSDTNTYQALSRSTGMVVWTNASGVSVDGSELRQALDEAGAREESDYTAESWSPLQTAVGLGSQLLVDPERTQQRVDDAAADIRTAIAGLVPVAGEPALAVDAEVMGRCVAGKAYAVVRVTNGEDTAIDVEVATRGAPRPSRRSPPGPRRATRSTAVRSRSPGGWSRSPPPPVRNSPFRRCRCPPTAAADTSMIESQGSCVGVASS
ncbi:MAG TPA: glycoside hydrolase family 127 protein [Arachnia sp.]|nr:glycoside hydrolase family 127 protein [Arachnia sp.]HMT86875.1 glycoside hydrolase family 127 protein [Arachnia sp.]